MHPPETRIFYRCPSLWNKPICQRKHRRFRLNSLISKSTQGNLLRLKTSPGEAPRASCFEG